MAEAIAVRSFPVNDIAAPGVALELMEVSILASSAFNSVRTCVAISVVVGAGDTDV